MSRIDSVVQEGEEIIAKISRSRLDEKYLIGYVFVLSLIIFTAVIYLFPDLVPVENRILPALAPIPIAVFVLVALEVKRWAHMYYFTDANVISVSGIFNISTTSIPYHQVTHTDINQSFIGRMFHHGDVLVDTAGTQGTEMIMEGIHNPGKYKQIIDTAAGGGGDTSTDVETAAQVSDTLNAELGRVQRQRQQLEADYQNGNIPEDEYTEQWYVLHGEEQAINRLLDRLE